jgi:hypothetical protein
LLVLAASVAAGAAAGQPSGNGEITKESGERQRGLIDAQVARFSKEPVSGARVFFLGFAGFGEERVFAEEIKLAAQRVGGKFGSSMRSVLLLNDRRDLSTQPFASTSSLRYSLGEIARVMNRDEDVLFLALSSHGSRDSTIAVSNTGMADEGLSARTLAELLEESGIKWRVIVVSACFSGAFVKPLSDDHTIVITAASKSRSSFGCSDQRDLTYFGEAFYRDALPRAPDLRTAFETSRKDIRRREKEEEFTPSKPQAFFGAEIEMKIAAIDATRPN